MLLSWSYTHVYNEIKMYGEVTRLRLVKRTRLYIFNCDSERKLSVLKPRINERMYDVIVGCQEQFEEVLDLTYRRKVKFCF